MAASDARSCRSSSSKRVAAVCESCRRLPPVRVAHARSLRGRTAPAAQRVSHAQPARYSMGALAVAGVAMCGSQDAAQLARLGHPQLHRPVAIGSVDNVSALTPCPRGAGQASQSAKRLERPHPGGLFVPSGRKRPLHLHAAHRALPPGCWCVLLHWLDWLNVGSLVHPLLIDRSQCAGLSSFESYEAPLRSAAQVGRRSPVPAHRGGIRMRNSL
jgi:hypothetical protein